MQWPILQMCISRCEKPLHNWSNALKSSFAKNGNRVTVKFWSQYLLYLQSYLVIFIHHLAAAVPLLETDYMVYITSLSIYYRDMTCFDGLYLKKSRSPCSVLGQNIDISFGPNGAPPGALWWSSLRAASLLLASFHVALLNEREKPSWIDWTIEVSERLIEISERIDWTIENLESRFDSLTDRNADTFDNIAGNVVMPHVCSFVADVCMFIQRWNTMCAGKALNNHQRRFVTSKLKIFDIDRSICWYFKQTADNFVYAPGASFYCWCLLIFPARGNIMSAVKALKNYCSAILLGAHPDFLSKNYSRQQCHRTKSLLWSSEKS